MQPNAVTVTAVSVSGPDATHFTIESAPALPAMLSCHQTLSFNVRFDKRTQQSSATLTIAMTGAAGITISLSGKGFLF